ncbi:hypothetical protein Tco_0893666 [Tanacetum coccineum]|uniref:Uncharacterized protein n=1 Tax=Tanacetum coccineum TaxID=301880 RepID=A0ABQ5CEW7_9ASTR
MMTSPPRTRILSRPRLGQKLNLTPPRLSAEADEFKLLEPYTVTEKPSAVIYQNMNGERRLMRSNELIKFRDGTLRKVDDELKHKLVNYKLRTYKKRVKDRKGVKEDKKLAADFIRKIAKILREGRIYKSLENFVGGRYREGDYRTLTTTY